MPKLYTPTLNTKKLLDKFSKNMLELNPKDKERTAIWQHKLN